MKWQEFLSASVKSLLWTLGALCLGLFPMEIELAMSIWDPSRSVSLEEFVRNGLIVGLGLALVGGVFIDTILSDDMRSYGLAEKVLYLVLPGFVAIITAVSFVFLSLEGTDLQDLSSATSFFTIMVSVSLIYCLIAKFTHFKTKAKE